MKTPAFDLIDLFCGAGGTSIGAEQSGVCDVIAAVNHDPTAIKSHAANHKNTVHFIEDIRLLNIENLQSIVNRRREALPKTKLVLHASLECTNFSNAKGGRPRDPDSRTLAEHLLRYVIALKPHFITIENVKEFLSWGDLDGDGKPVSKYAGKHFEAWKNSIIKLGYEFDYRLLNAADFGAHTSRLRLFAIFSKKGLPISFPDPTHKQSKRIGQNTLFQTEKAWKPVIDCLDLNDIGSSIFNRKKPLVPKTLRRIIEGLKKYAAEPTVMACFSPGYCKPLNEPSGALTTSCNKALVTPISMSYYKNGAVLNTRKSPSPTITTKDRLGLILPIFCTSFFGNPKTNPRNKSVNEPSPTITAQARQGIVLITNPQFSSNGHSVQKPAPTIIAAQKSYPLGLCAARLGESSNWNPQPDDCPEMHELRAVLKAKNIADVYLRMLKVSELKKIQGFPSDYILHGSQTEQKKFIGNSVAPAVMKAWMKSLAEVQCNITHFAQLPREQNLN